LGTGLLVYTLCLTDVTACNQISPVFPLCTCFLQPEVQPGNEAGVYMYLPAVLSDINLPAV